MLVPVCWLISCALSLLGTDVPRSACCCPFGEQPSVIEPATTLKEIQHKLDLPISVDFQETPFKLVLDDLRLLSGISIVVDLPALDEEGVSPDRPISLKLEGV